MPINARLPFARRRLFRLRNILLFLMLIVTALPLGGLYFFRIYENELVQQTERELIAQSAVLSASYRALLRAMPNSGQPYGKVLPQLAQAQPDYTPITPSLSLINPIHSRRPAALPVLLTIDASAQKAAALLTPVMQDSQRFTLAGMRLLDFNGTVIAGREEVGLSLAHIAEVNKALHGEFSSVIRQRLSDQPPPPLYSVSRGTLIRVFTAFPIIENGYLQGVVYLSRSPENIVKHLYFVKEKVFLFSLLLLALITVLVLLVSSTISRPIRELIQQTQRIKLGEQKQIEPLPAPVTYEVAELSENFVNLSQALVERSDYIRQFANHVSHEFKTPLTSMQGALELLQDHFDTMPKEQQLRFIRNLLADTARLRQLVNRLLELARADAMVMSNEVCNLHDVFADLSSEFSERGLTVHYPGLANHRIAIAREVLTMALHNLLENSLQHQAKQVTISALHQGTQIEIQMHDDGCGISQANRDKIFTPFFTTRRGAGGTGLGLAITQALLKAYHGSLQLLACDEGAKFSLLLPKAGMD